MLLHTNYLAFYYALYTINIDKLSEDYCEKKRPCCQAKCYLSNKMGEEKSSNHKGQVTEIKIKLSEFQVTEFTCYPTQKKSPQQHYLFYNFYTNEFFESIDHPPKS